MATITGKWHKLLALPVKYHVVTALVCLSLIELICFGKVIRQVGFYLDDWTTLCTLHFGPQDFGSMLSHYLLVDPKVIIRPVEVLHFAGLYKLFGIHPFGYHIFNALLEVGCAWLFYLCLTLLTNNRSFSFLASVLLLLLPLHDSTHYWVLCSSVTLSLFFYLASFWLTIQSSRKRNASFLLLAVFSFAISIFNYESFLPLCLLNVAYLAFADRRSETEHRIFQVRKFFSGLLAFGLAIGSLWVYQKDIVPKLVALNWRHIVTFDPLNIANTLIAGINTTLPSQTIPFFGRLIVSHFQSHLTAIDVLNLILIAAITCFAFINFYRQDKHNQRQYFALAAIGAGIIVLSYAIFALNPSYIPNLNTILNRINTGACIGLSLIIAAMVALLLDLSTRPGFRQALSLGLLIPLISFLTLANWAMAQPWILSCQTQKHVWNLIEGQKETLTPQASLILANCPRYTMWSPVFDGVWDFQSMVRLATNNKEAKGGVVSERIRIYQDHVADISAGYTCGTYPFKDMYLVFGHEQILVPIHDAKTFVETIAAQGMTFDLNQKSLDTWAKQIALFSNKAKAAASAKAVY